VIFWLLPLNMVLPRFSTLGHLSFRTSKYIFLFALLAPASSLHTPHAAVVCTARLALCSVAHGHLLAMNQYAIPNLIDFLCVVIIIIVLNTLHS
jgi:hypothetical protein